MTTKYFSCLLVGIASLLVGTSCDRSKKKTPPLINPEFAAYIQSFTGGVVSSRAEIKVRFQQNLDFPGFEVGKALDKDIFRFSPKIKGNVYCESANTLSFKPDEPLKSDETYDVEIAMNKLFEVPEDLKIFRFQFRIIQQSFHVTRHEFGPYKPKALEKNFVNGSITTADYMEFEDVNSLLTASQDGQELPIHYEYGGAANRHTFTIDSISRSLTEGKIVIAWSGKKINMDIAGTDTIIIPALDDFKVMGISMASQPTQHLIIQFSDPIDESQNLDGLISIYSDNALKFTVGNAVVKAFPVNRQVGTRTVFIEPGIMNVAGYKLKKLFNMEVSFQELNPEVRLIGKGVILPNSKDLIFPFEAVNLNAIDLKLTKIYVNNIHQFLQVNQLDGQSEIRRVGKTMSTKKIELNTNKSIDIGKWNAFSIDLTDVISADPGSVYQVELSFKKSYSLFRCGDDGQTDETLQEYSEDWIEDAGWDDEYYYYYPPGYDWQERDNPCHISYYNNSRWVKRNIFASNIGVIAKGSSNQKLKVAVTDILSTSPLSGVKIEVFDFQQQKISEVATNNQGFADIDLSEKPFLLVATRGAEIGYLRVDDGSSLSTSMFDVSGNVVQKGIKGFIYGERGVWRPGDSLFLTFILEDKLKVLPDNHPVSFELINPRGQVATKIVRLSGLHGFYDFRTLTEADAPTGIWTINVRVGGSVFTRNIRIETIKPNRLKINLDYGVDVIASGSASLKGGLTVKWLHGALARNLRANVTVTLNSIRTQFKNFEQFTFDDQTKTFYPEEQVIFDEKVNEQGKAEVKADLGVFKQAPGMLKADFMIRAFEEGGDFSTDFFSIPYAPYKTFVGIKIPQRGNREDALVTDSTYKVQLAAVDQDGKPVSAMGVEVSLYKLEWRWWWDVSNEYLGNYVGRYSESLVRTQVIDIKNGKAQFDLSIEYPEWGRFMVRVVDPTGGHSSSDVFYADWPSWVSRYNRKQPEGAKILSFASDKEVYQVGETATITIPTSGEGRALVSVENGSDIIDAYWVIPDKNQKETTAAFKVTEKMVPNVYIHVTYIQPHAQTLNDLPVRLYGIVSIGVEDPEKRLKPMIAMNDEIRPEREFSVTISEEKNRPMTYTLAIVDEGLLDLTRFQTPDPWAVFNAKEALGVKTWDLFDMVLGAYGGKMEKLFAIGGDAGSIAKPNEKANRFKPVVMFLGPYELKSGSRTHKLTMPRYVGSVRAMVIAGQNGAYGHNEKTVAVKNPLMILGTLPRVLGPGEEVALPITVFAMDNKVRNVKVEVQPNKLLKVIGESVKNIEFEAPGDDVVLFNLAVTESIGVGKVTIVATSANERATYDIELDVRNPNPQVTQTIEKILQPGETWSTEFTSVGMPGTNEGILEVSNIPPIDFGRRLKELIGYPYGCSEQVTSSAFPQLYLQNVMEVDQAMKDFTAKNVREAIRALGFMQNADGGFMYWPGAISANDWTTSYAGHFLLEAEALGYSLPSGFKSKWISYQKNAAKSWRQTANQHYQYYYHHQLTQAYRLYTLALANSADLSSMNRLREMPGLTPLAKWQLAAAYALAGQIEVAKELTISLQTDIPPYPAMNATFGSNLRDKAIILIGLVQLGELDKAAPLVLDIAKNLSSQSWYSTQTTAFCLMSLAKFAGKSNLVGNELIFDFDLKHSGKQSKRTQLPLSQIPLNIIGNEKGSLTLTNKGQSIIYARLALTGIPVAGQERPAENKLRMKVTYKTLDGNLLQPDKIPQGTDFIAEVEIINPGTYGFYSEMALTQILPSGWEIINTRLADYSSAHEVSKPDYIDIRDDRVYTFFGVGNKPQKFTIVLNAAYLGKYYLPAVQCEAMYDNSINALVPGKWVEVVVPGK